MNLNDTEQAYLDLLTDRYEVRIRQVIVEDDLTTITDSGIVVFWVSICDGAHLLGKAAGGSLGACLCGLLGWLISNGDKPITDEPWVFIGDAHDDDEATGG